MVGIAQLVRAPGCDPGGRRFESGYLPHFFLVGIAQLVRAPGCDPGGRRFESGYLPLEKTYRNVSLFFCSSEGPFGNF